MSTLNVRRQHLSRLRWLTLASSLALVISTVALAYAGNNPLPDSGAPHGAGITHAQYPNGYTLNGVFAPTFNSYKDNPDGTPNDERPFLTGWTNNGPNGNTVVAKAGDEITVRAFVHNDSGASGNLGGNGPSVAKNARILMSFPTNQTGNSLHVSSYIYADNAVVNASNPSLKTVSDDLEVRSSDGSPIKLTYVANSAKLLQSNQPRGLNGYQSWNLSGNQQQFLFSGTRSVVASNTEITPTSGVSIGSNGSFNAAQAVAQSQSQKLDWFGCNEFHGFVVFKAKVEAVTQPSPTPTPTTPPTTTPTVTPTPTPTPSPSHSPSPTPTPTTPSTPGPSTPPGPGPKGGPGPSGTLPVTGTSTMALLSAIALAMSGYLYIRERKALKQAIARYSVSK